MPELPEVETIVQQLRERILYKTIISTEIIDPKVIDKKINYLLPVRITNVTRKGKLILLNLDNKNNLLIQLRMTGHFHYLKKEVDQSYQNHLCGIFYLDDNSFFTYNSIRKFGSVQLKEEKETKQILDKLGPDALDTTKSEFIERIQKYPRSKIKTKLLDQSFIAGVGNIYALEALYYAGIDPQRKIATISEKKLKGLHQHLTNTLKLAIKHKGTTAMNYTHINGSGNFQNLLAVYNKSSCPQGHPINKITLAGRGTYYCPKCQR